MITATKFENPPLASKIFKKSENGEVTTSTPSSAMICTAMIPTKIAIKYICEMRTIWRLI